MHSLASLASFLVLFLLGSTSAQLTPVPDRVLGWEWQNRTAEVQIAAYFDWMCPDSRSAWPVLQSVLASYHPSQVGLVVHAFPLPYHYAAYLAAQAAQAMPTEKQLFQWLQAVFDNQEQFGNSNLSSWDKLRKDFNNLSIARTGVNISDALLDPTDDWHARVMWKHACSKGVSGTPFYFVNDVLINGPSTEQGWKALLDPLVQDNDDI